MLAGLHGLDGQLRVGIVGGADGDGVDLRVCQQLLRQRNTHTARADDGNFNLVLRFVVGVNQLLPGENP